MKKSFKKDVDLTKNQSLSSHGFSKEILGIKFNVVFEYLNEGKVTKCTIYQDINNPNSKNSSLMFYDFWSNTTCAMYTGYAKLNEKDGDVLDRNIGEQIAYKKALQKLNRDIFVSYTRLLDTSERFLTEIIDGLDLKLNKIQNKDKKIK